MSETAAMADSVIAIVAALGALSGLYAWVTRAIVRAELEPVRENLARKAQDIAVLKAAVFNHLAHTNLPIKAPIEREIREELGYETK